MIDTKVKLLIVEDDMITAAHISLQLGALGYEVTAMVPRGEDALLQIKENPPDIILLDIQLKGNLDGIQTALEMQKQEDIPVIYLTANSDEATFNRAKGTRPYAFISKPFKKLDLQRAIELTISRMANVAVDHEPPDDEPFILNDRIFLRHKDRMIKILIEDILYIEANRNYSNVITKNKEYLLAITLKVMEEKLPTRHFVRTHRSYLVNINHVDEVAENNVMIAQKTIPLSKDLRDELLRRIQMI